MRQDSGGVPVQLELTCRVCKPGMVAPIQTATSLNRHQSPAAPGVVADYALQRDDLRIHCMECLRGGLYDACAGDTVQGVPRGSQPYAEHMASVPYGSLIPDLVRVHHYSGDAQQARHL